MILRRELTERRPQQPTHLVGCFGYISRYGAKQGWIIKKQS
ncbi:hypothetical protein TcasGA2_TC032422 [Tribolium castaneum]|uniref:Uncharacterized protein n=1 Tax=Tribolium castaneum TaxID=7070 RepID=A0A139WLD6_TRICA|nr:hypothetical protein TcasGA2_TC032422 [Tribolium castaneum]